MNSDLFNLASYAFNPYAIPTLTTAVAIVALGFIVLVGERNSRVGLSFFIMTVTAGIWLFCYSFMYCAVTESTASTWALMGRLGIIFIPAADSNVSVGTVQIYSRHKHRVWLAWLVSGFFYATVLHGDTFISGVNRF